MGAIKFFIYFQTFIYYDDDDDIMFCSSICVKKYFYNYSLSVDTFYAIALSSFGIVHY